MEKQVSKSKEVKEVKEVISVNFSDMTDDQLTEYLKSVNADVIIEKSIKSSNIWKASVIQDEQGERSKAKVRKLRTNQVNLCESLNKWVTAKNKENINGAVALLYSFSKTNLSDIKNYMGGKRKEVTAEKVNKAYKYMLSNI